MSTTPEITTAQLELEQHEADLRALEGALDRAKKDLRGAEKRRRKKELKADIAEKLVMIRIARRRVRKLTRQHGRQLSRGQRSDARRQRKHDKAIDEATTAADLQGAGIYTSPSTIPGEAGSGDMGGSPPEQARGLVAAIFDWFGRLLG